MISFCQMAYGSPTHVPTKKVYIKNISFSGNYVTRTSILLRELNIHIGDSINVSEVEALIEFNKNRILNLQLYSKVDYCINHWDENVIEIEYNVTEILYWIPSPIFALADRNFNVWWKEENHELDRTNIGLELTRINFRGRDESINALVQLGYNKMFNLSYKIPYLDKKLRHGMILGLNYATGREINYITDRNKIKFFNSENYPYQRFQARIGTSYRKAYVAVHDVQLSYNNYTITNELYNRNPDYLGGKKRINYFELAYNYKFNNTDVRVYPLNGLDLRIHASKKGFGIDKDVNQFILYNESSLYKKISNIISSSFVFRGRFAFGPKQPYVLNRAFGYKNEYVRGYEYYVIDGSHYALLRSNVRFQLINNVVYQNVFKFMKYIPIRVYAKIYNDIGYSYSKYPGNSFLNNKVLNGYGLGLDVIISYYLKFRIEYSFNHLNQNGLFLHGSKE